MSICHKMGLYRLADKFHFQRGDAFARSVSVKNIMCLHDARDGKWTVGNDVHFPFR